MAEDWRSDLEVWRAPFLAALRHKTRMRVCPAYIGGLTGPEDRKTQVEQCWQNMRGTSGVK
jgi:hypothetical protein